MSTLSDSPQPGTALAALHNLLAVLFGPEELRRWVRYGPDQDIALQLPGNEAATTTVIDMMIVAYQQRGRIDREFFSRLRQARPHMHVMIDAVARQWIEGELGPVGGALGSPQMHEPAMGTASLARRPTVSTIQRFMTRFRADAGLFPAWPPATELAIGDYGLVSAGTFQCRGNLTQLGVEVRKRLVAAIPVVRHTSDVHWTSSAALEPTDPRSARTIELRFTAPGAYYVEARGVEKFQLDGWRDVERSLAGLPRRSWDRRLHLVVEVWRAASASVIVADTDDATLIFASTGEPADSLAAPDLRLSVATRVGGIFDALQVHDTCPVFDTAQVHGLFRPYLRDPVGAAESIDLHLDRTTIEEFLAS